MAGTAMHRSHVGIQEWFWTTYLVATHTPGFSAKQLERQIGCTYRTAWFMLHRLRRAMVSDVRSKLEGDVEADETIIGGPVKGKTGRGVTALATRTMIFGAVEVINYTDKFGRVAERAGRLRLAITRKADEESIGQFLMQNVAEGSMIRTDGWKGYSRTALSNHRHTQSPGLKATHIHRAFGNLKTWLNGTHHGVDPKYLQVYLDEFVFRFNRRKTPMAAFQTLLGIATCKSPQTLTNLKQP
jgi:transposase-like protein